MPTKGFHIFRIIILATIFLLFIIPCYVLYIYGCDLGLTSTCKYYLGHGTYIDIYNTNNNPIINTTINTTINNNTRVLYSIGVIYLFEAVSSVQDLPIQRVSNCTHYLYYPYYFSMDRVKNVKYLLLDPYNDDHPNGYPSCYPTEPYNQQIVFDMMLLVVISYATTTTIVSYLLYCGKCSGKQINKSKYQSVV